MCLKSTFVFALAAAVGCQPAMSPTTTPPEGSESRMNVARISTAQPDRVNKAELDRKVETLLHEHENGAAASLWLGGEDPIAWYALNSEVSRPAASAIKTFHLVELFAAFAGKLDEPLGAEGILNDPEHAAMAVFRDKDQQAEIRRELSGASVRQVGMVMMQQRTLEGRKVGNHVYNAAANLATAVLGGPEALTDLIHKRDQAFGAVQVRRYMLAERESGDNEVTAAALAVLYGRLASRRLAGIDDQTTDAIHAALLQSAKPVWYAKDGNLTSDPVTQVRAGWWETPKGPVVFVVMVEKARPGPEGREATVKRLRKTADALVEALSEAGVTALK